MRLGQPEPSPRITPQGGPAPSPAQAAQEEIAQLQAQLAEVLERLDALESME